MSKKTISVTMGRMEAFNYIVCENAVMRYWESQRDEVALDRYMPNWRVAGINEELVDLFAGIQRGIDAGLEEITVWVSKELSDVRWIMYRYVFDRDYFLMYPNERNEALVLMGVPFYTMFYSLAEKIGHGDRTVKFVGYR